MICKCALVDIVQESREIANHGYQLCQGGKPRPSDVDTTPKLMKIHVLILYLLFVYGWLSSFRVGWQVGFDAVWMTELSNMEPVGSY